MPDPRLRWGTRGISGTTIDGGKQTLHCVGPVALFEMQNEGIEVVVGDVKLHPISTFWMHSEEPNVANSRRIFKNRNKR